MSTSLKASTMLLLWAHVAAHGQHLSFLRHVHVSPINPIVKHPADKINLVTKDNNASAMEASDVSHAVKIPLDDDDNCTGVETVPLGSDGRGYRGCQAKSQSGKLCQNWKQQIPHQHTRTPENYGGFGLGDHNFCRNPDGGTTIWCYTTDSQTRWEYCDVRPIYDNLPGCGAAPSMAQMGRLDVNQKVNNSMAQGRLGVDQTFDDGLAQMSMPDSYKVYIGSSLVVGDGAGDGVLNLCHPFSTHKGSQTLGDRTLKVCGTGIKVTLSFRTNCETECDMVLGACDTSLPSNTCEQIDADKLSWIEHAHSFKIESCGGR